MSQESLEPLVTQCPNCATRFRVTESQLQLAAGRVRCGACLAVFEGTAHLSMDGEPLDPTETGDVDALLDELDEIKSREPEQAPSLPVIGGAELGTRSQSDLDEALEGERDLPDELLALEAQLLDDLREEVRADEEGVPTVRDDVSSGANEPASSIEPADAFEEEDDRREDEPELSGVGEALADEALVDDSLADESLAYEEHHEQNLEADNLAGSPDVVEGTHVDTDAWAEEVAEDIWSEESSGASIDMQVSENDVDDEEEIELQALSGGQLDLEEDTQKTIKEDFKETTANTQKPAIPVANEFEALHLSDVDIDDDGGTPAKRSWVTYVLILLGLAALPVQVLWFQYDSWVLQPQYRPIYQTLCQVVGCELPPLRDVSKIVSKKVVIRTHPENPDIRVVDVLMVNNAEFSQPYPLIELMATGLRRQIVAGKRYTPSQYLRGDARGDELMPPLTPVHVSLEIDKPGEDALTFEVSFR